MTIELDESMYVADSQYSDGGEEFSRDELEAEIERLKAMLPKMLTREELEATRSLARFCSGLQRWVATRNWRQHVTGEPTLVRNGLGYVEVRFSVGDGQPRKKWWQP